MEQDEVTRQIIGCCYDVHNALGPGFPERVYRVALGKSLCTLPLHVEEERVFRVVVEGEPVGDFRVDIVVEDQVILEIKSVIGSMPTVFAAQLLAYLRAAHMPVGLLVNFGNPSCHVKRLVSSKAVSKRYPRNHERNLRNHTKVPA